MRRPLVGTAVLVALVLAAPPPARCEGSWADVEKAVEKALQSENPDERARAFLPLHATPDPRAVPLLVSSLAMLEKEEGRIREAQAREEARFEALFTKKTELDRWFESSSRSSKDLDRYNKEVGKIRHQLDQARLKVKNLENDVTRARALIASALLAMGHVLGGLTPEALAVAIPSLTEAWLEKRDPARGLWWVDVVGGLDAPDATLRVVGAVRRPDLPGSVRGAALRALAARGDPAAHDLAVQALAGPMDDWPLVASGIAALRRLHKVTSIEPLIAFLKREDAKRLREDGQAALMSLTGVVHGPYFEPWDAWWREERTRFSMPPSPVDLSRRGEEQKGVTFYGIHTFSDRILFILDVSGSMDQASAEGTEGARPPKIDVARRELIGAVNNLADTDLFNIVFFNHEVVTWQPKMVEGTEANRRRAREWVEAQPPLGGTNIHDALETGFRIAQRTTGRPDVDTIFFMTDGKPTAGKLQEPETILASVAEWIEAAQIRIHCVGVGEHDEDFMRRLAALGGGTYVKR
jgi:hypothetical protein